MQQVYIVTAIATDSAALNALNALKAVDPGNEYATVATEGKDRFGTVYNVVDELYERMLEECVDPIVYDRDPLLLTVFDERTRSRVNAEWNFMQALYSLTDRANARPVSTTAYEHAYNSGGAVDTYAVWELRATSWVCVDSVIVNHSAAKQLSNVGDMVHRDRATAHFDEHFWSWVIEFD
jgi:hypothetical protein